ncbi:MAG: hypothetical protein C5B58_11070 [Acidobacteria bacterium]|nr:MAG: hypothetical protein C5B58_11070 [Acidobacteriota bacterium]
MLLLQPAFVPVLAVMLATGFVLTEARPEYVTRAIGFQSAHDRDVPQWMLSVPHLAEELSG